MDSIQQPEVIRDDEQRVMSMSSSESPDEISGPLGIWPFPILNFLAKMGKSESNSTGFVVTEIHRDQNGRIQSIEEIRK